MPDLDDRKLMAHISDHWGVTIEAVCHNSSVPPEFLAALIANESLGKADMKQFRRDVYERLLRVRSGGELYFDGITNEDLLPMDEGQLVECATSWGLTQIIGYHAWLKGSPPRQLMVPEYNLVSALKRFAVFSEHSGIDLRAEFADMFRCWATGRADGSPNDTQYVGRGLRRLALYRELTWQERAQMRIAA
jgi:hypothetical protein